jgi:hypothetical protein
MIKRVAMAWALVFSLIALTVVVEQYPLPPGGGGGNIVLLK